MCANIIYIEEKIIDKLTYDVIMKIKTINSIIQYSNER